MTTRFKPKFNIKKGDSVVVIAGDDKDVKKPHVVLAVYPDKAKVLVEGVNIQTKHTKPTAQNTKGGIVKKKKLQWLFLTLCCGMLKLALQLRLNAAVKKVN